MRVPLMTAKLAAAAEPKLTALAELRFVPVIVTAVPPSAGPPAGLIEVTVGAPGAPPTAYCDEARPVSDVVATASVLAPAPGFVTPLTTTLTACDAAIASLLKSP